MKKKKRTEIKWGIKKQVILSFFRFKKKKYGEELSRILWKGFVSLGGYYFEIKK